MARTNEIGSHKTTVSRDGGKMRVTYHETVVVEWDHKTIILRSGGWQTATTKLRMNQASNQFGLGFQVWQHRFEWFVSWREKTIPFVDGMRLED